MLFLLALPIPTGEVGHVSAAPPLTAAVPILLYHSIPDQAYAENRYQVTAATFERQMQLLRRWGYRTISIQELVDHLYTGYALPPRPIVITFDDGYQNVFDIAFPIMQRNGFTGTVYIVANRLNAEGFMHADQLNTLVQAGWEVGSHGMTHTNLTLNHDQVRREILQSRLDLNQALGIKVNSFAYPFGEVDPYISSKVYDYGYRSAVGVGNLIVHSSGTVFNLSRREVRADAAMGDFIDLLPWFGRYSAAPRRKYKPQ